MTKSVKTKNRVDDIKPDLAYYEAIGGDAMVQKVLRIFYDVVFDDPLLQPFFKHTHKETIRGKQFGFMKRCFTGDKDVYMGQRPRNAHHWMVIDDALFDHRQALMRNALEAAGMQPAHREKWLATEEVFRSQIVKDKAHPLYYKGIAAYWAEDAREERLDVDGLCDACQKEVTAGSALWVLGDRALCEACADTARERMP